MSRPDEHVQHDTGSERLGLLSPRELEVLQGAALGLTNAQVASRLDVTVHAVKFHLSSIYRKLGAGNRTGAVAVYLGHDTEDAARRVLAEPEKA